MSVGFTLAEFVESEYYRLGVPNQLRPTDLNYLCDQVREKCARENLKLDFMNLSDFQPDHKTWGRFRKIVMEVIDI